MPTVLSTAVPAAIRPTSPRSASPASSSSSPQRKAIKPIDFVKPTMAKNYTPSWITLGTVSGQLYGMVFKGANKSTVWYSVAAFKNAGVKPPKTWTQLLADAKTLRASGTPAYSIDGGDGWPLTDLFENVYLRTAGAAKYDQLAAHTIKWTDPSVKTALKTMAQIYGDTGNIYGGTSRRPAGTARRLGQQRLQHAAQGGHDVRGRLRADRRDGQGEAAHGLQRVPVPVHQRLAARGRRRRRHRRDVQGHARRRAR